MIRVVFLGTPRFAVPTLESLLADETTEVVGLLTQPDRPAGRGHKSQSPPVKAIAGDHGIPTLQSHRVKDDSRVMEFFRSTLPDVAVAVAFGQLLPGRVFDFPPHGTLNIHASLLPKYRGAAPVSRALLNGEGVTGVTLMRIEERLDSGPILGLEEIPVGPDATTGEMEDLLALRGASLLMRLLLPYVDNQLHPRRQDESGVSYAPMIQKAEACLDWSWPAHRIHNLVRALNPRPGAYSALRGQTVKVWRTRLTSSTPPQLDGGVGSVFRLPRKRIGVLCGDLSVIELVQVQLANRRRMGALEFANGMRLREREVFGEASLS